MTTNNPKELTLGDTMSTVEDILEIIEDVKDVTKEDVWTTHELRNELLKLLTQLVKEVEARERDAIIKAYKQTTGIKDDVFIKALTPPTSDVEKVHGVIISNE